MPRIVSYRGKSAEELQKMSLEEYSKIIKSRPRRAIKRMSVSYKQLIAKVASAKLSGKVVKTTEREAVILPAWIGQTIAVHDGRKFNELTITVEHLGHRLGDFVYTTKRVQHSAPGIRATRGSKFLAVK